MDECRRIYNIDSIPVVSSVRIQWITTEKNRIIMEYILHLLILICIYTMLAQSLNLSAGFGGLFSLAQAGFYGVGAYVAAILSVHFHFSFLLILFIAILINAFLSIVVASISLRTIDDYFIICTLGIQVIAFSLMNNWAQMTNGPLGIANIPALNIGGLVFEDKISFSCLSLFFVIIVYILIKRIVKTSFGYTLQSLSEDEIYTSSLGKNVYLSKLIAFTLSGIIATIPGVLYAYYISYIDPSSFTVNESIFILSITIIGGLRNLEGAFFAACFLILLPELLSFIGFPNSIAANIKQIIYGMALVLVTVKPGFKISVRRK